MIDGASLDGTVRAAAFAFLDRLEAVHGEDLPRRELARGFEFEGTRVPLLGPQGIFKPAILPEVPLSITTAPRVEGKPRPYEDEILGGGRIVYRYRGTDPRHRDNVGLRRAMERRTPLVYFFGLMPGWYAAERPIFIVGEDPSRLAFLVQLGMPGVLGRRGEDSGERVNEGRREYYTTLALQRVHQRSFRRRVLAAYRETCAVCRLRHRELLDAAHIIRDTEPRGDPVVRNGLSLCKLHHAAFDRNLLGVRPDLVVELREDLLREEDGPMLIHGLQGFQGRKIRVPRSPRKRPDPDRLEERYEEFRRAV